MDIIKIGGVTIIESIISKMVLDRTCTVCGGIKRYIETSSAKTEPVICKACGGKGYNSDCSNVSVLLTPYVDLIPIGVRQSMRNQNMYVVDTYLAIYHFPEELRGIRIKRLYTYCVSRDDRVLKMAETRLLKDEPIEIHMYFD